MTRKTTLGRFGLKKKKKKKHFSQYCIYRLSTYKIISFSKSQPRYSYKIYSYKKECTLSVRALFLCRPGNDQARIGNRMDMSALFYLRGRMKCSKFSNMHEP